MKLITPTRLRNFGDAIGAEIRFADGEWIGSLELRGAWPIPSVAEAFGKRSSCVEGTRTPVSCAEVELAFRARNAGWEGGWISAYNPFDRRFPAAWRDALIDERTAAEILGSEFPAMTFRSSGIPDLVFRRDGLVVAAECKRRRGTYLDSTCVPKMGGDAFRPTQLDWAAGALDPMDRSSFDEAPGIPAEALARMDERDALPDEDLTKCPDCGIDAWAFEEDGITVHEDFYVSNELWDATCPDDDVLRWAAPDGTKFGQGQFVICMGCFERRLGRHLTLRDFVGEDFDEMSDAERRDVALAGPGSPFDWPPSKRFLDRWRTT